MSIRRSKPIRKVSVKRARQLRVYTALRAEYLTKHPICECCGDKMASDIHHKNSRNGEHLNDVSQFLAVDRDCHQWIHSHPYEARQKGWLV